MAELRKIRDLEKKLIEYLLNKAGLKLDEFPFSDMVDEYEGGVMGSIGVGHEGATYAGDIIQAKYIDKDNIPVIITLTKDTHNRVLDLDFWKEDFSKLIAYPYPEQIIII